jgi:hypothetical protein
MVPLSRFLRRRGYTPINVGYFGPGGVGRSLGQVTRALEERLAPWGPEGPVHFVTHSMGGIVARAFLSAQPRPAGGRLVQLAPPNQGAALANLVRRVPLLDRVPALRDLGRTHQGLPQHGLDGAPPRYEVGVVAGRSFGPWHGDAANDGVVRVAETYLPGASDWILTEHFHTVIMAARSTWEQVEAFLETGRFLPEATRLERDAAGGVFVRRASGDREPVPVGRPPHASPRELREAAREAARHGHEALELVQAERSLGAPHTSDPAHGDSEEEGP